MGAGRVGLTSPAATPGVGSGRIRFEIGDQNGVKIIPV
jgi:hypothetical protein